MTFPHDHAHWRTLAAAGSVAVAAVVAAVVTAAVNRRAVAAIGQRAGRAVARRRAAGGPVVFAASLAISLVVVARAGLPHPIVQDEFAYLLSADTFARGRLTSPTPPAADALQSPHELTRPTYAAKYPPGQGLALAAGQVATGLPIAGAWLTAALAAVAIGWAAAAFVPPAWAVLAGATAAVLPQAVEWSHVFWGGGVAELGGAVLLGGWGRLERFPSARSDRRGRGTGFQPVSSRVENPCHEGGRGSRRPSVVAAALAMAVGLAILANSRPYEGLAFAAPLVTVALLRHPRAWLPLAAVLLPTAVAMAIDNAAVTGRPLVPPIVAYAQQFDVYPKLWPMPARATVPAYPNPLMAAVHLDFERGDTAALHTVTGFARIAAARAGQLAGDYADPWVLLVPLGIALRVAGSPAGRGPRPAGGPATRDPRLPWVWAALATTLLALWAETFFLPHYAAPVTAAVVVLAVVGWRHLWHAWPAGGVGIAVGLLAGAALSAATIGVDPPRAGRDDVADRLGPGRHLVLVAYSPGHASSDEWVYNDADPPAERVVWAHAGSPIGDAAVRRAYPSRTVWSLTVGKADLRLVPADDAGR